MIAYRLDGNVYTIEGQKKYLDGSYNIGCYVKLVYTDTETLYGTATTNRYGYWKIQIPVNEAISGHYRVEFWGSRTIPKMAPVGDWEEFDLLTTDFFLPTVPGLMFSTTASDYISASGLGNYTVELDIVAPSGVIAAGVTISGLPNGVLYTPITPIYSGVNYYFKTTIINTANGVLSNLKLLTAPTYLTGTVIASTLSGLWTQPFAIKVDTIAPQTSLSGIYSGFNQATLYFAYARDDMTLSGVLTSGIITNPDAFSGTDRIDIYRSTDAILGHASKVGMLNLAGIADKEVKGTNGNGVAYIDIITNSSGYVSEFDQFYYWYQTFDRAGNKSPIVYGGGPIKPKLIEPADVNGLLRLKEYVDPSDGTRRIFQYATGINATKILYYNISTSGLTASLDQIAYSQDPHTISSSTFTTLDLSSPSYITCNGVPYVMGSGFSIAPSGVVSFAITTNAPSIINNAYKIRLKGTGINSSQMAIRIPSRLAADEIDAGRIRVEDNISINAGQPYGVFLDLKGIYLWTISGTMMEMLNTPTQLGMSAGDVFHVGHPDSNPDRWGFRVDQYGNSKIAEWDINPSGISKLSGVSGIDIRNTGNSVVQNGIIINAKKDDNFRSFITTVSGNNQNARFGYLGQVSGIDTYGLWGNVGGFGGTAATAPKLWLNNEGMQVLNGAVPVAYVTGNTTWRTDPTTPFSWGSNLLTNGDFGSGDTAWTKTGPAVINNSYIGWNGTQEVNPDYAARFLINPTTRGKISQQINCSTFTTYTIRAWYRVTGGNTGFSGEWGIPMHQATVRLKHGTTDVTDGGTGHLEKNIISEPVGIDLTNPWASGKPLASSQNWRMVTFNYYTGDNSLGSTLTLEIETIALTDVPDATFIEWISPTSTLHVDYISITSAGSFTEMNGAGLLVYNSPQSYMQFGQGKANFQIDKITVGPSPNGIVIDGKQQRIYSANFTGGALGRGWMVEGTGDATFENANIRGMIHSSVFRYDTISALGGSFLVTPADVLAADMSAADNSTLITREVSFPVNSILRIKSAVTTVSGISDEYLQVTGVATGSGVIHTVTRDLAGQYAPNTNPSWRSGTAVVSMGSYTNPSTKSGFILMESSSDINYTPYIDVYDRNSATYNDYAVKVRLGNLSGITDATVGLSPGNKLWGLYAGEVRLRGTIVALSGLIGGATSANAWVIGSGLISSTGINIVSGNPAYIAFGNPPPIGPTTGTGIYIDRTGLYGLNSDTANFKISAIDGSIIALSGLIGGTTASTAWNIAAGYLSSTGVKITSGNPAYISFGSTPPTGPATGTGIYIDQTGLFGLNSNTQNFKISATDGSIVALSGLIGGTTNGTAWAIGNGYIYSTGIKLTSGASASIAFGNPPPTASGTGTGLWIDQTGLYGLNSNVNQMFLSAGGPTASGITFRLGNPSGVRLEWNQVAGDLDFYNGSVKVIQLGTSGSNSFMAGWNIDNVSLTKQSAGGRYSGLRSDGTTTGLRFFSGADDAVGTNATFKVTEAGLLSVGSGIPHFEIDGPNTYIQTSNFASGVRGLRLNGTTGNAEFNDIVARGEISSSIFTYKQLQATAGSLGVFVSAGKLLNDVTISGAGQFNIDIDQPTDYTGNPQLFQLGDILRIKHGMNDTWLKVTASGINQTTYWTYPVTKQSGSTVTYTKASAVIDYGRSDGTAQGFIVLSADDAGNSPYLSMATHTGSPWTTQSNKLRLGNLTGISDSDFGSVFTNVWGLYTDNVFLKGNILAKSSTAIAALEGAISIGKITGTINNGIKITYTGTPSNDGMFAYASGINTFKAALDGSLALRSSTSTTIYTTINDSGSNELVFWRNASPSVRIGQNIGGSSVDGLQIYGGGIYVVTPTSGTFDAFAPMVSINTRANNAAVAGYFLGNNNPTLSTYQNIAVQGIAQPSDNNVSVSGTLMGLYGSASLPTVAASTGKAYGVYGVAIGGNNGGTAYGIYATAFGATINYAGYFDVGLVHIEGNLELKSTSTTKFANVTYTWPTGSYNALVAGDTVLKNVGGTLYWASYSGITGIADIPHGGTGLTSLSQGYMLYGPASGNVMSTLTIGSAKTILQVNSGGTAPTWQPNLDIGTNSINAGIITGTSITSTGNITASGTITGSKIYNAVYNDIADFFETYVEDIEYGKTYVLVNGNAQLATEYCQTGIIGIASDTFGYGLGQRKNAIPIAVAGVTLAHVDSSYSAGTPLTCSAHGWLTKMKDEDVIKYPTRLIASYYKPEKEEIWNDIMVRGRHWVRIK